MSELIFIEQADAGSTGGTTIDEYLRLCQPVMEELGTRAAAVAVDETGRLLTPEGYSDNCLDVFAPSGTVVASRRLIGETWVDEPGVDYLTQNWVTAKGEDPRRFGALEYGATRWLYIGRFKDSARLTAAPTSAVWDASVSRLSPDGDVIVYVEFRAEPDVWLWTQDLRTGTRRPVCSLPQSVLAGDISVSGDGRWALVGTDPVLLVDLDEGKVVRVPNHVTSACWLTNDGPSVLLAARNIGGSSSEIGRYDLSTGAWERRCEVGTRLAEIDVSAQGYVVAVANTPGQNAWIPNVANVDLRSGEVAFIRPLRFGSGPWRRSDRPRWISGQPATDAPVAPTPELLSGAVARAVSHEEIDMGKMFAEWFERLQRRIQALEDDPTRTVVLREMVALGDYCGRLNPRVKEGIESVLVPNLNRIAEAAQSPEARSELEWAIRTFLAM